MRAWRLFPQQGKKQYVVKLGDCYYENDEEEGSEMNRFSNRCFCLACISAQCSSHLCNNTVFANKTTLSNAEARIK